MPDEQFQAIVRVCILVRSLFPAKFRATSRQLMTKAFSALPSCAVAIFLFVQLLPLLTAYCISAARWHNLLHMRHLTSSLHLPCPVSHVSVTETYVWCQMQTINCLPINVSTCINVYPSKHQRPPYYGNALGIPARCLLQLP
jgi:hypothetical protein